MNSMNEPSRAELKHILVFTLNESRYALPLSSVIRVIRVVEVTPLLNSPECIPGVINLHGKVVPVIDLRPRLGLPQREMLLDDRCIIAQTTLRTVAVLADSVVGVSELADRALVCATQTKPSSGSVKGLVKLADELIAVFDVDQFLSPDEETLINSELGGFDR